MSMVLSHKERAQRREAIATTRKLIETYSVNLRHGVTEDMLAMAVRQMTQSDAPDTQLARLTNIADLSERKYLEELRSMAHDDFTAFCELISPDEPPAPHHIFLCEHLEDIERGEIPGMILSMPPGHAKSTYASHRFPAWYLGRSPRKKFIQAGHSQDFVEKEFGLRVKGILESPEYQSVFPDVRISKESAAAGMFILQKHGGRYLTRGVGQKIAGFRANIAGVDDPYGSEEEADNKLIRDKVLRWFLSDFSTRLLPNSPIYIVATRWHPDDLPANLEKMSKEGRGRKYTIINLPAICDDEKNDPLNRKLHEPLWPSFYTGDELLRIRETILPKSWNSLYMGKPTLAEGNIFKINWLRRYTELPADVFDASGRLVEKKIKKIVISVDTASKTSERNDYTVITVWLEDLHKNHYLVNLYRFRAEFPDMEKKINEVANAYNATAILVEDKGSGTQYIQNNRANPGPIPVIAINVGQSSKEFRFDGTMPVFEAGRVYFPEYAPWLADLEAELLAFPSGTYDDQVDSTSQYLNWAVVRFSGGGTKELKGMGTGSGHSDGGDRGDPMARGRLSPEIRALMAKIRGKSGMIGGLPGPSQVNQGPLPGK